MDDITRKALSRRTFLGGALATGGLFLAGCGSDGGGSSSPSGGGSAGSGSAPSGSAASGSAGSGSAAGSTSGSAAGGGGTLRAGIPTDFLLSAPQRFNPSNRPLRRTVFDPILDKSNDGKLQPSIVTEWEWNSDKTSLAMTVRDGVTFHSGRDLTADDIVFSIKTALTPEAGVQVSGLLAKASDIKADGASKVVVSFDDPFVAYLDALTMLPVLDEKTYGEIADGKTVIGTGPFTWKSWTPASKAEMARFGSYWQEGKPYLDGISFSVITESQAMLAAMRSGDLDLANRMLARDAASLKDDSKFSVGATLGYDVYVGCSTQIKPMDDIKVRQAIAYCLDRDRIVDQVYKGFAEASCVLWPDSTPGVTDAQRKYYSYDIDKAKSLLADAGASGAEIPICALPTDPTYDAIAQIVQYGLEQAGLKVKPVTLTAAEWPKRNQAHDLPGLFVTLIGLTPSGVVPTMMAANPLTPAGNTSNFVTDEYTSLVNDVLTAATDDDVAKANHALTEYMIEQAFHNTVAQAQAPVVGVAGLSGVETDTTLSLNLTNAKLSA